MRKGRFFHIIHLHLGSELDWDDDSSDEAESSPPRQTGDKSSYALPKFEPPEYLSLARAGSSDSGSDSDIDLNGL